MEEGDSESSPIGLPALAAGNRPCPRAEAGRDDRSRPSRGKAVRTGGNAVIRQAISCDICGTEKKQTNHWFVAYDQGGELRVSGWNSRNRLRPGMKHLCGQTCLHKLVDEFMARTIAVRVQPGAAEESEVAEQTVATDCSLTSDAAFVEVESSSRLLTPPVPVLPKRLPLRAQAELVAMPGRLQAEEPAAADEPPRYASRNWRAEAWERERERELRAVERHPERATQRRSG